MKKFSFNLIVVLFLLLFVSACRKELVYDIQPDDEISDNSLILDIEWELEWEYGVDTDWENMWGNVGADNDYDYFRPRKPEGIAVVFYDGNENDYFYNRELHLPASGGTIKLDETTKAVMLYNDDSEYITLNGLASPHTAYATTRSSNRSSRGSLEEFHRDERTMNAPDLLYGAYAEIDDLLKTKAENKASMTLKPLVYGYVVRFFIEKNLEYIASAQGFLAGMAESIFIKDGKKSESKSIIPFSCLLTSYGLGAQIVTFGTPESSEIKNGIEGHSHDLVLEILLTNGKTMSFDFDITEQMNHQPSGGVIFLEHLDIPDDIVKGGSGFETDVDEWGDQQNIDINIKK